MKVAIVYDRANKWGGAERVLLTFLEIFPKAHLFTSVYYKKGATWAKSFSKIETSFLQNIVIARNRHEHFFYLMPFIFESFDFSSYDLVISVTSEFAKGVITKPETLHVCYCLTPTRYLWSSYDDYVRSPVLKFLSWGAISYLRKWDRVAASRPDVMVAISNSISHKIRNYYDRDSVVIYPPCELEWFDSSDSPEGEYFLIVSRLVPYKRVDIAIEAFNKLGRDLVVVGSGVEKARLKRMAKDNISFVEKLTDTELRNYYRDCRALIYPQIEDFGLAAVEAQSMGKPVIALRKGGALDTVVEKKTGIFFKEQSADALIEAIYKFEKTKFNKRDIILNTKRFSKENFKDRFLKLIYERRSRI